MSVGIIAFYQVRDKEDLYRKLNYTLNKAFHNYHDYRYKEVVDLVQHRVRIFLLFFQNLVINSV